MLCGLLAERVKRALEGLPEIESADVDLASDRADVRLRPGVSPASLDRERVRDAVATVVTLP